MGWIMMSERELNRIEILSQVNDGRLGVMDGALLLGLSKRQIFRLLVGFRKDGPSALQHKARGKAPNNIRGADSKIFSHRLMASPSIPTLHIERYRIPRFDIPKTSNQGDKSYSNQGNFFKDQFYQNLEVKSKETLPLTGLINLDVDEEI